MASICAIISRKRVKKGEFMLQTHDEIDIFRRQLSDILGLPSQSSTKNGKHLFSWYTDNHNSIFEVMIYKGTITIFKTVIVDIQTLENVQQDKVIAFAQTFLEEVK